jgi:hypothetical protein
MSSPFVMTPEIALKSQIKKLSQKREIEKLRTENRIKISEFVMINMWRKLYENGLFEEVDVWYYLKSIEKIYWHGNSRFLGIKTTIANYTMKQGARKGKTIRAHFSCYGEFLQEAKKDDVPKFYTDDFKITEEQFDIDYKNLEDYDIMDIEQIFIPKKQEDDSRFITMSSQYDILFS